MVCIVGLIRYQDGKHAPYWFGLVWIGVPLLALLGLAAWGFVEFLRWI